MDSNEDKTFVAFSIHRSTLFLVLAIAAFILIGFAAAVAFSSSYNFKINYVLVIMYPLSFAVAFIGLNKNGMGNLQNIFVSLAAMVSGARLYEVFYHYLYAGAFNSILSDITSISLNIPACPPHVLCSSLGPFPVVGAIILISLPLAFYRYMKINDMFMWVLILSIVIFGVWYFSGYPQYVAPQWYPQLTPLLNWIPADNKAVYFWGIVFISISHIVCLLPALLFWEAHQTKTVET